MSPDPQVRAMRLVYEIKQRAEDDALDVLFHLEVVREAMRLRCERTSHENEGRGKCGWCGEGEDR